jgi:hypothetical protein
MRGAATASERWGYRAMRGAAWAAIAGKGLVHPAASVPLAMGGERWRYLAKSGVAGRAVAAPAMCGIARRARAARAFWRGVFTGSR